MRGKSGKPKGVKSTKRPAAKSKASRVSKVRTVEPGGDIAKGAQVVEIKSRVEKAEAAKTSESVPVGREFHQELECALNETDLAKLRDEMAAAVTKKAALAEERKAAAARFRQEEKGLEAQVEQIAGQVTSRSATRPVRCRRVEDIERKKIATFRLDTDECIDVKDMTESEAAAARAKKAAQLGPDVKAAILSWEKSRKKVAEKAAVEKVEKMEHENPKPKIVAASVPTMSQREVEEAIAKLKQPAGFGKPDPVVATDLEEPEQEQVVAGPGVDFDVSQIPGISRTIAQQLIAHQYGTLDALLHATSRDLVVVPGVGQSTAERILLYVEENYGGDVAARGAGGVPSRDPIDAAIFTPGESEREAAEIDSTDDTTLPGEEPEVDFEGIFS